MIDEAMMKSATHEAKDAMLRKLIKEMHALADKAVGEMTAEDQKSGSYEDKEVGETPAHEATKTPALEAKEDAGLVTDEADELQKKVRGFMSPPQSKGRIMGMISSKKPTPQFGNKRKG